MLINKESEKHIRNLARCLNRLNKPFKKLGNPFTLSELRKTKDLPQVKKDSIFSDVMGEVSQLLSELGIDYKDYPGGYKDWETVTLYQFNLEKAKLEKQNLLNNNKIKT
ncbi:hypothetical protein ES695_07865 [Candidatus Atribacteria bacterium 1244-E10-H5-B2]|nr:MAG: hypothetical protein ES695_07865 [Candidatus Atribacteria bacterium 1244-E10-H5-B2]